MTEEFTRTTIVLFPPDVEIVNAADTNDAGRSATIRKIIREWATFHPPARTLVDTKARYDAGCADG